MRVKTRKEWTDEFAELGPEEVRARLVSTRWARDKRDAARVWVERHDAHTWQEARGEGEDSHPSFILWMRGLPWWWLIGPGFLLYTAVRLFARLRHAL